MTEPPNQSDSPQPEAVDSNALFAEPQLVIDTYGQAYWKYRSGGYNQEDGSYGRCADRLTALKLIEKLSQANNKSSATSASDVGSKPDEQF